MKKKNVNFETQIKNSQQFLQKLQNIKKASKQLKDKNKLTLHRNIWVKQLKYLSRLQRDTQLQMTQYLQDLDKYLQYQYQDKQIFKNDNFKKYLNMKQYLDQQYDQYSVSIWSQIQSLPLLLQKIKKAKKQDINYQDVSSILNGISQFINKTGKVENNVIEELNQFNSSKYQDNNDDFQDIVYNIKPIFDQVRGFDFQRDRFKKVQEGQNNLIQYLQSMSDKLSQDQISQVIEQFHHASNLLYEAVLLEIQKINLDYEEALNLDQELTQVSHNFQKINHFYQIYLGRGRSVAHYYQRLSIQFPKISRNILQRITTFIQAKIYKQKKIKTAKRNYLREKQQIFIKVQKQVNLRIQNKIKKAQKEAQKLSRREEKLKLEKELEKLRCDYQKRQQIKRKQQNQEEQKKKQQQRKKEAIRKLYLDDLSKRVSEIQEIKQEKNKQEEEKIKAMREKEQQIKKKKIEENKPKVNFRHSLDKRKIQKKLEEKQYREQYKIKNQDRINKAIENYPFRPVVQLSEERLNAPTEALIKKQQTKYDKADKILLSKVDGYTVNQLMGDIRFKLNTAFQEAGIAHTDYAKEVINGLSKKPNN